MEILRQNLWSQFGAAIDMLENVIELCTDDFLQSHQKFFYITFHILIFLDYYLTIPPKGFVPFLSFTEVPKDEIPANAIDDLLPDRFYTKSELITYLKLSRVKCKNLIKRLEKEPGLRFIEELEVGAMDYSAIEILFYNMRHVQHHTAQLNMLLRTEMNHSVKWIGRTTEIL